MQSIKAICQRLTHVEIYVILIAVALSIASARLLPVALATILLFGLIRWLANGRLTQRTPLDLPIVGLIALLIMTAWLSPRPDLTLPQIMRTLNGIGLYYALINSPLSAQRVANGFLLMGLALALISPFVVEWFPGAKLPFIPTWLYNFPKIVSDTVNPNPLATLIIMIFALGAGIISQKTALSWRSPMFILSVITLVLLALNLFISQSRGGLIAFATVLFSLGVLMWRRVRWLMLLAVLLASLGVWRFNLMPDLFARTAQGGPSTLQIRLIHWTRAIELIQQSPITGIGMGVYPELVDRGPRGVTGLTVVERAHAHNMLLQIALDLGLPGLVLWLGLFIIVIILLVRSLRDLPTPHFLRGAALGLIAAQLGMLVANLFDSTLWGVVRSAPFLWAMWALAIMVYRESSECRHKVGTSHHP